MSGFLEYYLLSLLADALAMSGTLQPQHVFAARICLDGSSLVVCIDPDSCRNAWEYPAVYPGSLVAYAVDSNGYSIRMVGIETRATEDNPVFCGPDASGLVHDLDEPRLLLSPSCTALMLIDFWLSYLPRARAVLLFAGLGLFYMLAVSLVFLSSWEFGSQDSINWPLSNWTSIAGRVGVAIFMALIILWLVRPGKRSRLGYVFGGLSLFAYTILVSYSYDLTGVFLVVPVVLRYWLNRRLSLGITAAMAVWGIFLYPHQLLDEGQSGNEIMDFWQSTVLLLGQGLFAFIAFELTLRREENRAQLREALLELRQYRDLELQHATLEERTRLSRDLHDTLGHELTALRLEVQRARKVQQDAPALAASLNRALERSTESMGSLQAAVKALRPQKLGISLLGSIEELVRAWPTTVVVTLPDHEPALETTARLAAFRCVQEGLTNAQKHAQGGAVSLQVREEVSHLTVTLCNALPSQDVPSGGGMGLKGLRERVEAVGGQLHVGTLEDRFCLQATFLLLEA